MTQGSGQKNHPRQLAVWSPMEGRMDTPVFLELRCMAQIHHFTLGKGAPACLLVCCAAWCCASVCAVAVRCLALGVCIRACVVASRVGLCV
jgi:hypothetical protein